MKPCLLRILLVASLAACGGSTEQEAREKADRIRRAQDLLAHIEEPGALDRLVALGENGPVLEAMMKEGQPERVRRLAAVAAGRIGGPGAGEKLLLLFDDKTGDLNVQGARRLYAAVGLRFLGDPAFAVDLVERLASVDPNNGIAALAAEERQGEYYTVDAQLCDALLGLGIWNAEEDLVKQLLRRDRIRVLIDASEVLRRRTGLSLPFRYNGSYDDRAADAARWLTVLRSTRGERLRDHPFRSGTERFRKRCTEVVGWLGSNSVNNRYIAYKILPLLGSSTMPFLVDALRSNNPVAQRQAAHVLGMVGDPSAAPALRDALSYKDDDARAEALGALRLVGDRAALGVAREHLADPDPEVRAAAADFLAALGTDDDRGTLREAMSRERAPSTEAHMTCALFLRGDRSVVDRVLEIFRSGEQLDRELALAALESASGKAGETSALASPEDRKAAAERMGAWFR